MAARKCASCSVSFPNKAEFKVCPICYEPTTYLISGQASEDWEIRSELYAQARDPGVSTEVKIVLNRFSRFQDAGLDIERSLVFAGARHDSDAQFVVCPGDFERLLSAGCPLETAAKIVAP